MKDILFSPYINKHKAPLGALSIYEECSLKVYINKNFNISELELVLKEDENRKVEYYKCNWINSDSFYNIFEVRFSLTEYYIYFYYFQFVDCYGRHFICRDENMDAILLDEIKDLFQVNVFKPFKSDLTWFKGSVMYQIFVDRFYKGGNNPVKENVIYHNDWNDGPNYLPVNNKILNNDFFGGDLQGVIEKLDYLKELNVGAIYLNPIFLSFSNHKYDTADYMQIDPMFGGEKIFKKLCKEANKKGIKIILDGVFNHTGSNSIYFNKENSFSSLGAFQSKESPYYKWYRFKKYPNEYESWWGIDTLPSVNQENDGFMNFITNDNGVLDKWLSCGASGFRLDVVDELNNRFVNKIHKQVKKKNSDNILIGEVWEDASNKIAYGKRRNYFNGEQLDSVMNYPLKNAIVDFVRYNNLRGLKNTVNAMINNLPKHVLDSMMNLLSTHDTARIISVFSNVNFHTLSRKEQAEYKMSKEVYYDARAKLKIASAILYTLPGVPCIYYGDECGVEGYKDPFCRHTMPWDNMDLEIVNWYKKLGNIRKNEVFTDGEYFDIETNSFTVFAFGRRKNGKTIITIANNSINTNYYYRIVEGYDLLAEHAIKDVVTVYPMSVKIFEVVE